MKPIKKPMLLALGIFFAGIVGVFLNIWLLTNLDSRQLLPAGHISATMLYILGILVTIVCLAAAFLQPKKSFYMQKKASFIDAFGCLIAAVALVIRLLTENWDSGGLPGLTMVLSGLAAVSFLVIGYFRFTGKSAPFVCYGVIILFFMLYPISQHAHWSKQTQLWEFLFPVLSALSFMLYSYRYGSLAIGKESRRWTLLTGLMAIFTGLCSRSIPGFLLSFWVLCSFDSLLNIPQLKPMELPENILFCLNELEKAGHRGYLVGGCVRDHLLGIAPHDYDLCTDAKPQELCDIFAAYTLVRSGEKHGTIGVVLDGDVIEITTFRTEGNYTDSRHPDWVNFVTDLKEDLRRRDFTVNAIAYNPETGFVDPFSGVRDLFEGTLQAVGDPEKRFQEDALRILRGIRFSLRFRLTVEKNTFKAMHRLSKNINLLASERIFEELCKILLLANWEDLCLYASVFARIIPELKPMLGFRQHSPHHAYDVYLHTAHVVNNVPKELPLRWAALLHDTGKPEVFTRDETGRGHFYEHAQHSAVIADQVLRRLKAPTALREQVCFLVENHMLLLNTDKKLLKRRLSQYGEETLRTMIALQKADHGGKGIENDPSNANLDEVSAVLDEVVAECSCLHIKDLAINGQDLIELGFAPGPKLGDCLNTLLQFILEDQLPNEKQTLLEKAKTLLEGENI